MAYKLKKAEVGNIRKPTKTVTLLLMDLDIGIMEEEISRDLLKGFPKIDYLKRQIDKGT